MINFRKYKDYDEYKEHQKNKLSSRFKSIKSRSKNRIKGFVSEIDILESKFDLSKGKSLCLAARLGEEVRAFIKKGYDAVGIDLNPGPDNDLVIQGDFHNTPFEESEFDIVYCNSLDHAFDLEKVFSEIKRVLKTGGHLILGLNVDFCGLSPEEYLNQKGKYESVAWTSTDDILKYAKGFSEVGRVHIPLIKRSRPERHDVVFLNE